MEVFWPCLNRFRLSYDGCVCAQSCPALCNPIDCNPPDSSVHRIPQARILEWVAIPFSTGSLWPRDQTWVSCIAGRFFTVWTTREASRLPGSSVCGILQARILKWVAIPFSRGIFPTQGLNPSLLHCRQILYHLILYHQILHQGSPQRIKLNY